MRTKTNTLYSNISTCDFDFIALTETWLTDNISNSEIFPSHYVVFRNDRNYNLLNSSRGGGVLLVVKNSVTCTQVDLTSIIRALPTINIICVKISLPNKNYIFVVTVYIPPSTSFEDYELFTDLLSNLEDIHTNKLIIVGDFNIPNFVLNLTDKFSTLLVNFANFIDLTQYNYVRNANNHILDLVFSNLVITIEKSINPLVDEDNHHPALELEFQADLVPKNKNKFHLNTESKQYNFKKANFLQLYESLLTVDWSKLNETNDVNVAVTAFYDILYQKFDASVPILKFLL